MGEDDLRAVLATVACRLAAGLDRRMSAAGVRALRACLGLRSTDSCGAPTKPAPKPVGYGTLAPATTQQRPSELPLLVEEQPSKPRSTRPLPWTKSERAGRQFCFSPRLQRQRRR
jgi:hypothetical protein